ncbi:MAG: response regulator [Chloroherpetonaceae bacterium]|nr:response regulator [Chloroherpetonaceae bacterium]MDW8438127.1 response regulator [Chloroherpetonaceae bacterium]
MPEPTILFVDDEPMILNSLRHLFDEDYEVLTADSGRKGLDLLARHDVSVVVSDQRMPEMLGHEFLAQAKALRPDAIRILLTGYSDIDDTIRSINDGEIFRYVNKPWQAAKLSETINLAYKLHQKLVSEKNLQARAETLARFAALPPLPHLLVIDDNEPRLAQTKALLERQYDIHVAATPEIAFEILASKPISVLLMESFRSGPIDEAEFLTILKTANPDVVSILVSDVRDAELAKRLVNEGSVFRYLIRPFSNEALKGMVGLAAARAELYLQSPAKNIRRQENDLMGFHASIQELAHPFPELVAKVRRWYETRKTY